MIFDRIAPSQIRKTYYYESRFSFFGGLFFGFTTPFLLVLARRMGASTLTISIMAATPFIGHFSTLFWADLMDNKRKKPYVVIPNIVGKGLFLLAFFSRSLETFVIISVLSQIIVAISSPAQAAILKKIYPDDKRGRAMGLSKTESALAMIVSTLIAGKLMVEPTDYRYIFPIAAIFGIIGSLYFNRLEEKPDEKIGKQNVLDSLKIFTEDPRYTRYTISFFIYGLGNLMGKTLYPLALVDILNASNFQVGILNSAASVLKLIGFYFWGRYIDRKFPTFVLVRTFSLWGSVPLLYLIICNLFSNAWFILPAFIISGLAMSGGQLGSLNSQIRLAKKGQVPRYVSLHKAHLGIRGMTAPFLAIQFRAMWGMNGALLVTFGLIFIGIILMYRFNKDLDTDI